MPAQRTTCQTVVPIRNTIRCSAQMLMKSLRYEDIFEQIEDLDDTAATAPAEVSIYYPTTVEARNNFRTRKDKRLTTHEWAVYDFALRIPRGNVTTYKNVSLAVGGSPRSVGNALRKNPFSPHVPCHRVIASNLFVGGFFGEWGKDDKTGTRLDQKVSILSEEGVHFDRNGYLMASDQVLLKPGIVEKPVD